ncbi:TIGR03089 family protein [Gordonia sp. HY002]|uniref:TIGR03089 family protein n=1 Tax=Gordonia zhenghanii TaxID=2911516 RepID=UPI001EF07436|nr:TIGR03089 family protein [Gordonia zhenghanii]MCF8570580.1 TIGR03089 family protein [Gordonia zhenghanii]MCF8606621.1 TIGR03089 family protein [Gordonia zhenghanii]
MTDTLTSLVLGRVADPARPLFTFYDEGTGERTELSAATLGNWAAKIANYLRDEVGVVPGDDVRVDLPEHWQSAAVLLGAWWAGAHVLVGDHDGDARVVFTAAARLDQHDADAVVVVPLDPFAMGSRDLPIGVDDFGESVRAHGDRYSPAGAGDLALDDVPTATLARVESETESGQRVVSTRPWHTADTIAANFLAPLLAGTALVWIRGADDARVDAIAAMEKADLTLRSNEMPNP